MMFVALAYCLWWVPYWMQISAGNRRHDQ